MAARKGQPAIFTKLALPSQRSVKNSHAESHANPTNGLVIETKSQTDGRTWSPKRRFLLRKEHLKLYILSTKRSYTFRTTVTINTDYFPVQH